MPREDWVANTVECIFEAVGLYPTGKVKSVLDVACGLSLKSQYIDAQIRVGVDIYRPYLEKIQADVPYVALQADALDIVEHLEKPQSLRLMEMAEQIARVAVIVETPKGYVPQNIDIWGHGGDEFQTHRCGWEPEELAARGYRCVLRDYRMSAVRRHTEVEVAPDIQMIDAIKRLDR